MNRRDFIGGVAAGTVAAGLPKTETRTVNPDIQELFTRWVPVLVAAAEDNFEARKGLFTLLKTHGGLTLDRKHGVLRNSTGRIVG